MPPIPRGMTQAAFEQRVMRWGSGDEAARQRINTLTRAELEAAGVSLPMAQVWLEFYKQEKAARPANPSAQGRAELMQRAVQLLEGED